MNDTTILDTPDAIAFAQMCARKAALKMEIRGLYRSGGKRTAYSICKSEYGLKGTRESVLIQMQALVDGALAKRADEVIAQVRAAAAEATTNG